MTTVDEVTAAAVAHVHAGLADGLAPYGDELDVRNRDVTVLLATGELRVLRARTTAGNGHGQTLSWDENLVLRLSGVTVVSEHAVVPITRVRAFATGRERVWVPPRRPTTVLAAGAVGALMRLPGRGGAPVDVVARYVEEFKNRQRFAVFPRLFAPGFRHHFGFPGRDGRLGTFMDVGRSILGAFTDLHVELTDLAAAGDMVLERNRVDARHTGSFTGEEPTGRPVSWSEIHVYRVVSGRIVENWPGVDSESILDGVA